jgi:tRNA(Arg) A34 adenosine deaminase TadA
MKKFVPHSHRYWMQKAIEQAKIGKTPYGTIIAKSDDEFISAYNTTTQDGAQAHAEMNAISKMKKLNYNSPRDLRLYTTVEPCPMCMSAVVWAGIGQVIYGATIDDANLYGKQIYIRCRDVADKAWFDIKITPDIERQKCIKLFKFYLNN